LRARGTRKRGERKCNLMQCKSSNQRGVTEPKT
jgi:hypothetical protein